MSKLSRQELNAALNQELDNLANQVTTERVTDALGYTPAKTSDITWSNVLSKPDAFAPSSHTHDWADILNKPTDFAPTTHSHAWTEITGKPSTFTPAAHTHLWANITDKPTTFAPSTHSHSYNDLTNKPAIPTLNNTVTSTSTTEAATANAVKTAYDLAASKVGATVATTSADGLMSSADKTKLEGIATGANNYTLPTATASVLGGVRTSTNITNASGVISVANASTTARGVVQLNNTLTSTSTSEAATAAQAKTLNDNAVAHGTTIASTSQLGHVRVDGTTITVDSNGVIKSAGSNSGGNIQEHVTANAPHQYGGKFEWRFNPTTNSLDLVVL